MTINHYDPIKHEYRMNGVIVPSVTQIIPQQDFHCTIEQLEAARREGIEDHSLIKMYLDTRSAGNNPMLRALERWLENNKAMLGDLILYERPLYSEKYKFGGKPDTIFSKAFVDYKRNPGDPKYHALQLAGYYILAKEYPLFKKTKSWLIAWYDGDEFKARNVYNDLAESAFLSLLKKYQIEQTINNYFKTI